MMFSFIDCGRYVASLLVLAILILITVTANAQKLKFGIRSGVSLANYIGHNASGLENPDPVVSAATSYYDINGIRNPNQHIELPNPYYKTSLTKNLRTGFYAGVFLDIRLNNRLNLEPGIAYTQKGIDLDFTTTQRDAYYVNVQRTYRHTRSIQTNYISIPIVVKYSLGRKEHFYVTGGVYNAFAIKTQIKNASSSMTTGSADSGYLSPVAQWTFQLGEVKTRVVDFGFVGGFGFNLPMGSRFSLGVDARVNVGLINVKGDSAQSSYLNFSSSTKNINLETGLRAAYVLSAN